MKVLIISLLKDFFSFFGATFVWGFFKSFTHLLVLLFLKMIKYYKKLRKGLLVDYCSTCPRPIFRWSCCQISRIYINGISGTKYITTQVFFFSACHWQMGLSNVWKYQSGSRRKKVGTRFVLSIWDEKLPFEFWAIVGFW